MKTFLLFPAIIFSNLLHSQNIFPLLSGEPRWNVTEWFWDESTLHQYFYSYDTLLCGQEYSVVSPYHFFVRTEVNKVFIRLNNNCDDPEHILYDFGLTVGDKIWVPDSNYPLDSVQLRVDNVDTAIYFGINRKRLQMAYDRCSGPVDDVFFETMYWIEGIGSDLHPFYNGYCFCDACESGAVLNCYDSAGVQLYGSASEFACDIIVGIVQKNGESFKLFPNPSNDMITIESPKTELLYCLIYDDKGSLISSVLFDSTATISVTDFKPGIYLVQLRDLSNALKTQQMFSKI